MTFRLHLVRHAEGTHNPSHDKTILDPPLTARGIEQCEDLSRGFIFKDRVGLVITSPLRRTLQTSLIGFQGALDEKYYANESNKGVKGGSTLLLEAEIQAHSARPCDTGSDARILHSEFPNLPWDSFQLDPVFPAKEGIYSPELELLKQRGQRVQRRLFEQFKQLENTSRPDIVIVTHGGFIRFLTGHDSLALGPAEPMTFSATLSQTLELQLTPLCVDGNGFDNCQG